MVSVYRGTGRVSYLALFNVSDVLVGLATLAGTGRASSRETFEQIFVSICFFGLKNRMETQIWLLSLCILLCHAQVVLNCVDLFIICLNKKNNH